MLDFFRARAPRTQLRIDFTEAVRLPMVGGPQALGNVRLV